MERNIWFYTDQRNALRKIKKIKNKENVTKQMIYQKIKM